MRYFGLIACLILWFQPLDLNADYRIRGRINLSDGWQPQVFMAAVHQLNDYYRASPDLIVDAAIVDPDGYFEMRGNNLPKSPHYYRLYMMKEQNSEYDACLYVGGEDHNFIHLILDNDTELEILADAQYTSPFGNYTVVGDEQNQRMRTLARLVYPSFYFYQIKFPSELRFSEEKLNDDLIRFADTCESALVALAAVHNTDFDQFFERNKGFYRGFADRLKNQLPGHIYIENYARKLRYYMDEPASRPSHSLLWIALALSILANGVFAYLYTRTRQKAKPKKSVPSDEHSIVLTQKEKEILRFIREGKSNKEIASALYIELSTVKSHINKIYSKLRVQSRNEAIAAADSILK